MKRIVIGFSFVRYTDIRRIIAQENAISVLASHPDNVFPISFDFQKSEKMKVLEDFKIPQLNILKRDSSIEIQNNRRLPYIKEILNNCYKINCDVFGYINSDILVSQDVYNILQQDFDAYIFSRSDIGEVSADDFINKRYKVIYGGDKHIGADGFFFNRSWWNANKDKFPDGLLIGTTEFDTCYRVIIKNSGAKYLEKRVLYHTYHDQTWTTTSPSALNNIAIWNEIKKKYGIK